MVCQGPASLLTHSQLQGKRVQGVSKFARASFLGFIFVFLWLVLLPFLLFPLEPDFLELVSWGAKGLNRFW